MAIDANAPEAQSAKGLIASTLAAVGLPASLADQLWNDAYLTQGQPLQSIIDVYLPGTDAFKTRFPAFNAFQAKTGGTVKDYIAQTDAYAGAMKAAGLPAGFYDTPDDFAKWINGGVSPKEVSDRITLASQASQTAPPEVRDFLVNQEGLSPTDLAAFFLDPDKGDLVKAKARYTQAEIGGAAKHAGFGDLTLAEATKLQAGGTTGTDATTGFGQVAAMKPLFTATAGETTTGTGVGRADALAAVGGEGDAQAKIARTKATRQAVFEGGGGASGETGRGGTGLGGS